ncbi:histidine phosphatase family protein [Hazenella sp. IB182357]|uniref:Histidine phosphatase family protein n=1 Tax=Polycladospora coralii TaxID=2771432 RepID=A0A926NAV6_9BACL|nr:histidine phosphatase family protein [Polycladospora coralii]MBD1371870.1 histidine phosphatase family protein [Polycladospora coralii]MBS7529331.1 histidine phosphatase family protein [Polycladospora coralii]
METIYLIRHCQAEGQAADAPLTPTGEVQAEALGDFLAQFPIDTIVSSPYRRAVQSVEPLAKRLSQPIHIEPLFQERVLSDTSLPDWKLQLEQSFIDLDLRLVGGESSRDAMERGIKALEGMKKRGGQHVVVVTHGNLLTLLLKSFDERFGFNEWEQMANPDVFQVDVGRGEVMQLSMT